MARGKGACRAQERLIEAAGRGFRRGGFGGIGVDALAREAGLTSGAFYAQFGSKAEAFRLALTAALDGFIAKVGVLQAEHGAGWTQVFIEHYLGAGVEAELPSACGLVTLTADAARACEATRAAYEQGLCGVVGAIAEGLTGERREDRAWALLALLSGAAAMARAAAGEETRAAIRAATAEAALRI